MQWDVIAVIHRLKGKDFERRQNQAFLRGAPGRGMGNGSELRQEENCLLREWCDPGTGTTEVVESPSFVFDAQLGKAPGNPT